MDINEIANKYLIEKKGNLLQRFGDDMKWAKGAIRYRLAFEIESAHTNEDDPFELTGKDHEAYLKWTSGDKNWDKDLI
jgi:hypothetical protein